MSSLVDLLRSKGATFAWGVNKQGTRRHAYPDVCALCDSVAEHRRNHVPHALCGHAWGPDWPLVDDPKLLTCRSCQRILIGGWP